MKTCNSWNEEDIPTSIHCLPNGHSTDSCSSSDKESNTDSDTAITNDEVIEAIKSAKLKYCVAKVVRQIRAEFNKNCGFCGKSTKLGTIIVYDMVNNFGCGAHRDLSHNNSKRRFLFCPPENWHGNEAGTE